MNKNQPVVQCIGMGEVGRKKAYHTPGLTKWGSLRQITRGSSGGQMDQNMSETNPSPDQSGFNPTGPVRQ